MLLVVNLIKLLSDRKALLFCDILSAFVLIIPLIWIFIYQDNPNNKLSSFSIVLIVIQSLLGFIHSYRFIHLKNIVYYVASDDSELKKMNIGFSLGLGISFVLSPLLSLFIYNNLPFYSLVILNIVTYLLSGLLYWSIATFEKPNEFEVSKSASNSINIYKGKHYKFWSWMFILACSFIIGIILFPKNSGLIQYFQSLPDYSYQQWSFYFTIIMSISGLLGTIFVYLLNSKKSKIKNINISYVLILISVINISWIPVGLKGTSTVNLIYYITINATQQVLFSLFLPSFYSISYKLFDHQNFHKQNGISLIFRIILSSSVTLILTYLNNFFGYFITYTTYSVLVFVLTVLAAVSYYILTTYKSQNYYNTETVKDLYLEYNKNKLWYSEKAVITKYLKQNHDNIKILDIGCGAGRTTFAIAELYPNSKIDAIDISKKLINECRNNNNNNFNNITFKFQDITKFRLSSKFKYDFAFFSFNGITNILKAKKVHKTFSNISRSLKDNGYFIFTTHNLYSEEKYREFWDEVIKINDLDTFSEKKVLNREEYGTIVKNRFYTFKDIEFIAKRHGFEIIEHFNRDEDLETENVKSISTPVTFYVLRKK
ncbi:MFS transporter [Mycoplasma buteonis]|uniref:MFS transporter n=1 Tax=Mycoplasma buteonis TaxID=171280 RepID=UPI00068E2735|nr:MFS transporter [Mycoplasma buteonis]